MTFAQAVQNTPVLDRTTNGMLALEASTDPVVDLFYKIGASRGKNIVPEFERAYQFDSTLATRVLLWSRDVRGGAGERKLFRDVLVHLENLHPEMLERILPHISEFGRWDDLLVFNTKEFQDRAYALIAGALNSVNGLCAKWMPRKGPIALALRNYLGLTPKQYRKLLVNLTNVVETKMCAKDWNNINFSHVPSVAAARYQRAFGRNAPDAYAVYKQALTNGTATVNAGAVYPHDVIKTITAGDQTVARAQWEALPNYMGESAVLPMVDVSGSMNCSVGGNPGLTCMDVAVALGLYCADKNRGAFKDLFLTFTSTSKLEVLRGDIVSKCSQLRKADWGMSTNLHSAFEAVLNVAVSQHVPQEDMPKYILILSDMQFNRCVNHDDSAMQMIARKYQNAGYTVPNIVFWNLHDYGTVPVSAHTSGAALVSGFSPSIMKSILAAKEFTPRSVMLDTINQPRYCVV